MSVWKGRSGTRPDRVRLLFSSLLPSASRFSSLVPCPIAWRLRFPSVHSDINQLSDGIVHAHFGEAAVARFLIRFTLGAGRLSSLQGRFHILNLEPEVIDS